MMSVTAQHPNKHELESSLPMSVSDGSSETSQFSSDDEESRAEESLHGTSWTRRSLIEDAKFENITNAEFEKQERRSVSNASDVTITTDHQNEADENEVNDDVFPVSNGGDAGVNGHVIGETGRTGATTKKCTVMLSLRDANALSRLFKHFENGRNLVQHVETRKSRKTGTALELLVTFESGRENVLNVVKTLKTLSAVQDVVILNDKQQQDANQTNPIWIPRHVSDLDKCNHLLTKFDPELAQTHPGFSDLKYRERRKLVVEQAFRYKHGDPLPRIDYSPEEVQCWGTVFNTVKVLIEKHSCAEYLHNFHMLEREFGWNGSSIPQLADVSEYMQRRSGFRLRPVAGLLSARDFLASLAFRVFQCTQYIRHPSRPDHTVEPDCIHELLGHIPMLSDPRFAQFSQEIGLASLGASDEDIVKFATLYWFSVEFGLCRQQGEVKVYGAAILSAYGEFQHAISDVPAKYEFEPHKVVQQEYDDQDYQNVYFICESFQDMTEKVRAYARGIKRPYEVRYDPYTQSVQVLDNKNVIQDITRNLNIELNTLTSALQRIQGLTLA